MAFPEREFIKLAMNGLEIELHKKLEGMEFKDLFELFTKATRYEWLLRTYYIDPNNEINITKIISKKCFLSPIKNQPYKGNPPKSMPLVLEKHPMTKGDTIHLI